MTYYDLLDFSSLMAENDDAMIIFIDVAMSLGDASVRMADKQSII